MTFKAEIRAHLLERFGPVGLDSLLTDFEHAEEWSQESVSVALEKKGAGIRGWPWVRGVVTWPYWGARATPYGPHPLSDAEQSGRGGGWCHALNRELDLTGPPPLLPYTFL